MANNGHGHHGPLEESGRERNHYILVMGEYLTRYIITAPMPDQTAETVTRTFVNNVVLIHGCLLYTSPSPRDRQKSRMPSSA